MATRISLNIEAGNAGELKEALIDLAGTFDGEVEGELKEATTAATGARRGRPRKPAEALTAAQPDTTVSGAPAAAQALADLNPVAGVGPGLTATVTASPSEPVVTKEMVSAAMQKAMGSHDPGTLQKGLTERGLPVRIGLMTPEQYPAALAFFTEASATPSLE